MATNQSNLTINNKSGVSGDFKSTYLFFYGFLVLGLVVVLVGQWPRQPLAALLWSLACLATGSFIGFLFGIPKVAQVDGPIAQAVPGGGAAAGSISSGGAGYRLLVNTNLTDISDWLTKIIVGLTLIELQKIPENLGRASLFIAYSLGGADEKSFAGGMLVFFSVGGFLGGYLFTRLFLTGAFFRADQPNLTPSDANALSNAVVSQESGSQQISSDAEAAAKQIRNRPLDQMSPEEIPAWAKAQLLNKDYRAALEGYDKAILQDPNDVKLRVEKAVAASHAGQPRDVVKDQLLDAYRRLTTQTSPAVRASIYKELTYACLYLPPPEGFNRAIQYAEEYLNDPNNPKGGRAVAKIYTNLAAAYGQKYHWFNLNPDPSVDLSVVRAKALDAVKKALAMDPTVREQLRLLMDPNYPNKDHGENDLEVFANDPEFREVLEMSAVSGG